MDVFSRTFLPATTEAELPIPLVSRHMPVLRSQVTPAETAIVVTRCRPARQPLAGTRMMLLLTNRHLVVSRESRMLRRPQLHLASDVRDLTDVVWATDRRWLSLELAVTTWDGIRERFLIPARDARRIRRLDALFSRVFRYRSTPPPGTAPRASSRLIGPVTAW
jgi:hypothetical protein